MQAGALERSLACTFPSAQLLSQLAAIGETVLIYPSAGGPPKARRMTTELSADQLEAV